MIRVTIEIVPRGREEHKNTLGTLEITNDGCGILAIGHYDYRFDSASGVETGYISFQRSLTACDLVRDVFVDMQKG